MKSINEILQQLRARGERLTIQRRAVIEILSRTADHLTIQDIHTQIQPMGISMSETTIYRILEWLKGQQLVAQTDIGVGGIVYSLLETPLHHHLICLSCGTLFEVDDSYFTDVRDRLKQALGFTARIEHMAIYGQCAACSSQLSDTTSSHPLLTETE